jgi:hypothetical protein
MDDSAQQALALLIVAAAIIVELWRRYRRKQKGKPGCDGCETGTAQEKPTETKLTFYKRSD